MMMMIVSAPPTGQKRDSSIVSEADGKSSFVINSRSPKPKRQRDSASATKRVAGRSKTELQDEINELGTAINEQSDDDTMGE